MIVNNAAAKVGMNYTIDVADGMFLVAYPNENAQTEFEFKYWVDVYEKKRVIDKVIAFDFSGTMGKKARIMVIAIFFMIFCCVLFCIGYIYRSCI